MPYSEDNLLSDVAEFYVHDVALHQLIGGSLEIQAEALEVRDRIFQTIENPRGKGNGNLIKKALGAVHKMQTKYPVRQKFIDFLEGLSQETTAQKESKNRPNQFLTKEEKIAKGKAKNFYDSGNYQAAVAIGLSILQGREARNNAGVIGFVMNCYNKLNDFPKALAYAERLITIEREETGLACFAIAGISSYKLGNYKKALEYYEKALVIGHDEPMLLSMAHLSAFRAEEHYKSLKYAKRLLEIEPKNLNALITIMKAADILGYKGDATRAAQQTLIDHPTNITALEILKKHKKNRKFDHTPNRA